MAKTIRIYAGDGALKMCASGVEHMMQRIFNEQSGKQSGKGGGRSFGTTHIRFIDSHEMISTTSHWQDSTDLLVFSGGGVTAFKKALGVEGVKAIQAYVANGGHYLGLCAGAYFGAADIHFTGRDWKTGHIYTKQNTGLGFFNGLARGSVDAVAPTYDGTSATCAVTDVLLCGADDDVTVPFNVWAVQPSLTEEQTPSIVPVFYGGGPEFAPAKDAGSHTNTPYYILSYYTNDTATPARSIAGVSCPVGTKGGQATLISWHPELDPVFLSEWMRGGHEDEGRNRLKLARQIASRGAGGRSPQEWLGRILKQSL